MASYHSTSFGTIAQRDSPGLAALRSTLDLVDASALIARLLEYRQRHSGVALGRKGFTPEALWRAYLARFLLNLPSVCALVRRLQDDPVLRRICGLSRVPHRSTFSYFFSRLAQHRELVEEALACTTDHLKELLPGLGETLAIDSTTVRTHSNARRPFISDPEASWTAKTSTGPNADKNGKEWHFGYKLHLAADAVHNVPLFGYVSTASRTDSPELPGLLRGAMQRFGWLRPAHVTADRGYDAQTNHQAVLQVGAVPVIPMRRNPGGRLLKGIYTTEGAPTCLGLRPMEFVREEPGRGRLYRCPAGGCHLADRKGVLHCRDEVWEDPNEDTRLFGVIRRGSPEWRSLYGKRQAVERIFKSLKQGRSLEGHCHRGLLRISLHAILSVLAFQATVLFHVLAGQWTRKCWMVRKIA